MHTANQNMAGQYGQRTCRYLYHPGCQWACLLHLPRKNTRPYLRCNALAVRSSKEGHGMTLNIHHAFNSSECPRLGCTRRHATIQVLHKEIPHASPRLPEVVLATRVQHCGIYAHLHAKHNVTDSCGNVQHAHHAQYSTSLKTNQNA